MPINRFRGQYYFLSNFYSCPEGVEYEGDLYPTSEHAYQAAKIEDRPGRDSFTVGGSLGTNPMEAKRKGGKVAMRAGFDSMRVKVMGTIIRSKFARDPRLQELLTSTGNQKIVEGHTNDKFWGGKRNHLGNCLMRVRDEIAAAAASSSTGGSGAGAGAVQSTVESSAGAAAPSSPKARSKGGAVQVEVVVRRSDPLFMFLPKTTTVQDIVTAHLGYGDVSAVRASLLSSDDPSPQQVDLTCTLESVAANGCVSLIIE